MRLPRLKVLFLLVLLAVYLGAGVALLALVESGAIERSAIPAEFVDPRVYPVDSLEVERSLAAAIAYMDSVLIREDGHVYLVEVLNESPSGEEYFTNSEAMSYTLLWAALTNDKARFDRALDYIEAHMIQEEYGYLMWKLDENSEPIDDGVNIASDADLRALRALTHAQEQWGDQRYGRMYAVLADGLESVAITDQMTLAPYGGANGDSVFIADETWLSYADYEAFDQLAELRGEPWISVRNNMEALTLDAQNAVGFFDSTVTSEGTYSNALDDDTYSVNNLWIIARAAQSDDSELQAAAQVAVSLLEERYLQDTELYARYNSQGHPLSPRADAPWVYALVGRAAIALDNTAFANDMMREMIALQSDDGSIREALGMRVSQFTQQETIITIAMYREYLEEKRSRGELITEEDVALEREPFRERFVLCVSGRGSCFDLIPGIVR